MSYTIQNWPTAPRLAICLLIGSGIGVLITLVTYSFWLTIVACFLGYLIILRIHGHIRTHFNKRKCISKRDQLAESLVADILHGFIFIGMATGSCGTSVTQSTHEIEWLSALLLTAIIFLGFSFIGSSQLLKPAMEKQVVILIPEDAGTNQEE